MKHQVLAVCVQKGGVGKTTTAAVLAQAAAYTGIKALAIDMDPQGNLTLALDADARQQGSFELLEGAPAADTIQTTEQGIDVIAAGRDLATVTSSRGSARRLQRAIEPLRKIYPLIVIDVPATPGELQYNAIQAATGLVIPIQPDTYNIQSLYQTSDTAAQIQQSNPELSIKGILATRYNGRSNHARQLLETLKGQAAALNIPFLGTVRETIAVSEAATFRISLYEHAPKSTAAGDYLKIFEELTK